MFHFDVDKISVQATPTHNAFTYGLVNTDGYLPCSKMQSSVTISVDSISSELTVSKSLGTVLLPDVHTKFMNVTTLFEIQKV